MNNTDINTRLGAYVIGITSAAKRDETRPLLERTYPLSEIAAAQRDFLKRRHVGNLVLLPPELNT